MNKKQISKEIADIAVELQEHVTLPIHCDLRIQLFDLANKIEKEYYTSKPSNPWVDPDIQCICRNGEQ